MPPDAIHARYVSFEALLPRAAAIIHHGGIGSVSQALRAATPQLIQPMAFDQFDNASRVVQLGAGRELLPRHFQPDRVATELAALLGAAAVQSDCRRHAAKLQHQDGISGACDVLLDKLVPQLLAYRFC